MTLASASAMKRVLRAAQAITSVVILTVTATALGVTTTSLVAHNWPRVAQGGRRWTRRVFWRFNLVT